jgi:hypothetical protein
MKTPAKIADHPKARLYRELVETLRASGSMKGAEQTWIRLRLNPRLWKRIVTYGLGLGERQWQLNRIAFPEANAAEVDAALRAGNNLNRLYELSCGHASIAKDSAGHYKIGNSGLKIIQHATVSRAPSRAQETIRGRGAAEFRS